LRNPDENEIIWALKDISFAVKPGEVLGIIGKNGAGKSTLLKILSRITEPSSGRARINGRVGSLLEVGTGFHPELTGRENIYLSGAILGMHRAEIDRKFDEIVAFAETGKFLDTPVKRYSSGMYVRLAFAVAAHLEPEVLLVDEVLAVGDLAFQKKCLGKMGNVAKEGRTVLFVSHNMVAVQNLCDRVLWLHESELKGEGPTNEVISQYLAVSYKAVTEQIWNNIETAPGNDRVRIHRIRIRPVDGEPTDHISMDAPLLVEIEYWNLLQDARLHISLHFYNEQQIVAFTSNSNETDPVTGSKELSTGLYQSTCHIPGNLFNAGTHRIMLLFLRDTSKITYRMEDALSFEVLDLSDRPGTWYGKEPGVVRPKLSWTTSVIGN
jgi:lipopolysaccharide transport system ATP-binding protein